MSPHDDGRTCDSPRDEQGAPHRPAVAADLAGGLGAGLLSMLFVAPLISTVAPAALVAPNEVAVPVFYLLWCLATASFVSTAQLGRPGRRCALILGCAALSAGAPIAMALAAWSPLVTGAPTDHEVSFVVVIGGASVLRFAAWLGLAARRTPARPRVELLLLAALSPLALAVTFLGLVGLGHHMLSIEGDSFTTAQAVDRATLGLVIGLALYVGETFAFWLARTAALQARRVLRAPGRRRRWRGRHPSSPGRGRR